MNEPASGLSACAGSLGAARPSKARDASNEKRVEWGGGEGSLSLDSFIHVHRLVRLRVFFFSLFGLSIGVCSRSGKNKRLSLRRFGSSSWR